MPASLFFVFEAENVKHMLINCSATLRFGHASVLVQHSVDLTCWNGGPARRRVFQCRRWNITFHTSAQNKSSPSPAQQPVVGILPPLDVVLHLSAFCQRSDLTPSSLSFDGAGRQSAQSSIKEGFFFTFLSSRKKQLRSYLL